MLSSPSAPAAVADASLVPAISAPVLGTPQSAAVAAPAPVASSTPIASFTSNSRAVGAGFGIAGTAPVAPDVAAPAAAAPVSLTPLQRRVKLAPALGKVTDVVKEHGFVILDAGKTKQVTVGMKFDLRRDAGVVGRIQITEVEDGQSIADLDPKSVPTGVEVNKGDDVIQAVLLR